MSLYRKTDIPQILTDLLYIFNPCVEAVARAAIEAEEIDTPGFYDRLAEAGAEFPEGFTLDDYLPDEELHTRDYRWTKQKKRNQQRFKNDIIKSIGESKFVDGIKFIRCMITGNFYPSFLVDAAHIFPHRGARDDDPQNGLLLRKDLHALFDAHLIGINPKTLKVELHPTLLDPDLELDSNYLGTIKGRKLKLRKGLNLKTITKSRGRPRISPEALQYQYRLFKKEVEQHRTRRRRNPQVLDRPKVCGIPQACRQQTKILPIHQEIEIDGELLETVGIDIRTTEGKRYQLLLAEIYGTIYNHKNPIEMAPPQISPKDYWPTKGYRYITSVDALDSSDFREIFKALRLLFMGDICINPFLNRNIQRLAEPQREAVFYGSRAWEKADLPYEAADSKGFSNSWAAGEKAGILALPTGMGKTICAAVIYDVMYRYTGRTMRLLFLSEQREHLINAEDRFVRSNPQLKGKTGFIFSRVGLKRKLQEKIINNLSADVVAVFATRQSCYNRLFINGAPTLAKNSFDLIIVDECHHAASPQYQKILGYLEPTEYLLGLTATPFRYDAIHVQSLFGTEGFNKGNANPVYRMAAQNGADIAMCILDGYLSQVSYLLITDISKDKLRPKDYLAKGKKGQKVLIGDTWHQRQAEITLEEKVSSFYQEYKKLCKEKFGGRKPKTLIFCGKEGDKQAQAVAVEVANYINAKNGSCVCRPYISAEAQADFCEPMTDDEVLEVFNQDEPPFHIITSVGRFNEGLDVPGIEVLVFLTYTGSPVRQIQQLGRGLRLAANKRTLYVLDLESNYSDLFLLINEGRIKPPRKQTGEKYFGKGLKGDLTIGSIADCETSHESELVKLLKSNENLAFQFKDRGKLTTITRDDIDTAKEHRSDGYTLDETLGRMEKARITKTYEQLIEAFTVNSKPSSRNARIRYIMGMLRLYSHVMSSLEKWQNEFKSILSMPTVEALRQIGMKGQLFAHSMYQIVEHTSLFEKEIIEIIYEKVETFSDSITSLGLSIEDFAERCVEFLKNMDYEEPFKSYFIKTGSARKDPYLEAQKQIQKLYSGVAKTVKGKPRKKKLIRSKPTSRGRRNAGRASLRRRNPQREPEWLTVRDAATLFGVSLSIIYRCIDKLPVGSVRLSWHGSKYLVDMYQLAEYRKVPVSDLDLSLLL